MAGPRVPAAPAGAQPRHHRRTRKPYKRQPQTSFLRLEIERHAAVLAGLQEQCQALSLNKQALQARLEIIEKGVAEADAELAQAMAGQAIGRTARRWAHAALQQESTLEALPPPQTWTTDHPLTRWNDGQVRYLFYQVCQRLGSLLRAKAPADQILPIIAKTNAFAIYQLLHNAGTWTRVKSCNFLTGELDSVPSNWFDNVAAVVPLESLPLAFIAGLRKAMSEYKQVVNRALRRRAELQRQLAELLPRLTSVSELCSSVDRGDHDSDNRQLLLRRTSWQQEQSSQQQQLQQSQQQLSSHLQLQLQQEQQQQTPQAQLHLKQEQQLQTQEASQGQHQQCHLNLQPQPKQEQQQQPPGVQQGQHQQCRLNLQPQQQRHLTLQPQQSPEAQQGQSRGVTHTLRQGQTQGLADTLQQCGSQHGVQQQQPQQQAVSTKELFRQQQQQLHEELWQEEQQTWPQHVRQQLLHEEQQQALGSSSQGQAESQPPGESLEQWQAQQALSQPQVSKQLSSTLHHLQQEAIQQLLAQPQSEQLQVLPTALSQQAESWPELDAIRPQQQQPRQHVARTGIDQLLAELEETVAVELQAAGLASSVWMGSSAQIFVAHMAVTCLPFRMDIMKVSQALYERVVKAGLGRR